MKRIDLYLNFERPFSEDELARFKALLKRRLNHEPLQYILGETEFMSLPFKIDRRSLIPRPETEILVQTIVNKCKQEFADVSKLTILDIGTGSGNIAISLARYLSNIKIVAIDCSEEAISLAKENALLNQVSAQISWKCENALGHDIQSKLDQHFHIIVSNPPYISAAEFQRLPPEIQYNEPKQALYAGEDGLRFYRSIGPKLPFLLYQNGFFAFEIGQGQADPVGQIFRNAGLRDLKLIHDLNGIERVIVGKI